MTETETVQAETPVTKPKKAKTLASRAKAASKAKIKEVKTKKAAGKTKAKTKAKPVVKDAVVVEKEEKVASLLPGGWRGLAEIDDLSKEPCMGCGEHMDCTLTFCPTCGRSQTGGRKLWTYKMRFIVYVALRKQFENKAGWEKADGKTQHKALEQIAEFFKEQHGIEVTARAIDEQVSFAIRPLPKVSKSQTPTFFHNRSAAHAAGFIGNKEMEVNLTCDWS